MLLKILKNSAIYGLAPFVPKIISILILPILTNYLTSSDFGIIGTITSILGGIQVFSTLGLQVILPNYFYKCTCQYKLAWREIYGFLSLWMIGFAIFQAIILYFCIPEEAIENKWLIILLSNFSTVFFGPTALIGQTYYQLNINPIPVAVRVVVSGLITILVNFLCVVVFQWGYMGSYIGSFAGTFFVNMSYWLVVNYKLGLKPIYRFKHKTIKGMLKVSLPTLPHYYTTYLLNSTNVVVMNVNDKTQSMIGELNIAQTVSNSIDSIINAINQVVYPLSLKYIKEKNVPELIQISYLYILITYLMTFFYSLWSKEIFSILVHNEQLKHCYTYSIVLVMALNYRPMYIICSNYFFFFEKTKSLLKISFLAGIISTMFYLLLIPHFELWGAVWGYYVGCIFYGYIGYYYKSYKEKKLFSLSSTLFFLIQIIMTLIAISFVEMSLSSKAIASLIFIIICIFAFILIKNGSNGEKSI